MDFVQKANLVGRSNEIKILQFASEQLFDKMTSLNISDLKISDYSRVYLAKHQSNLKYLLQNYTYILFNLQKEVGKPFEEISVIDHGAGTGVLSFLCKELGMQVISNDIYGQVLIDSKVISNELGLLEGSYHHGSISELAVQCKDEGLLIDAIISAEVIEHIYDLNEFFDDLKLIPSTNLSFVFSTSANIKNPLRRNKLKKLQFEAEFNGSDEFEGRKKKDSILSFLEIRKNIISTNFPELQKTEIEKLGKLTRGLNEKDILETTEKFVIDRCFPKELSHKSNTCDPKTGNWTEHLIDPMEIQKYLLNIGLRSKLKAGFYSIGSDSKLLKLTKTILNIFIKILKNYGINISHSWLLISDKK